MNLRVFHTHHVYMIWDFDFSGVWSITIKAMAFLKHLLFTCDVLNAHALCWGDLLLCGLVMTSPCLSCPVSRLMDQSASVPCELTHRL